MVCSLSSGIASLSDEAGAESQEESLEAYPVQAGGPFPPLHAYDTDNRSVQSDANSSMAPEVASLASGLGDQISIPGGNLPDAPVDRSDISEGREGSGVSSAPGDAQTGAKLEDRKNHGAHGEHTEGEVHSCRAALSGGGAAVGPAEDPDAFFDAPDTFRGTAPPAESRAYVRAKVQIEVGRAQCQLQYP